MNCDGIRDRLNAFLDHETDAAETWCIQEHLMGCSNCQAELRELQRLNTLLGGFIPDDLPDRLNDRVLAGTRGTSRHWTWFSRLAVAASFALMLLFGLEMGRGYVTSASTSSSLEFGQESLYTYFGGTSQ